LAYVSWSLTHVIKLVAEPNQHILKSITQTLLLQPKNKTPV